MGGPERSWAFWSSRDRQVAGRVLRRSCGCPLAGWDRGSLCCSARPAAAGVGHPAELVALFCPSTGGLEIAVGTALAGGPPRRSQRAELPHWAPASGSGIEALARPGMDDANGREPPGLQTVHALPVEATALAAATKRLEPVPDHLRPERPHGMKVARHGVVVGMASHHACEPPSLFGYGLVPTSLQLGFHLLELGPHPFCDRDAL